MGTHEPSDAVEGSRRAAADWRTSKAERVVRRGKIRDRLVQGTVTMHTPLAWPAP